MMRLSDMLIQTLDRAPKLFRKSFKQVFWVGFTMALLNELALSIMPPIENASHTAFKSNNPILMLVIFLVLLVLTTVANSVTQLILMSRLLNKQVALNVAFQITLNRLIRLLIAGVLFSAALMLGLMLYILPGLIFAALFFLYQPVILFENIRVIDAFKRSFQLAKPYFLFTFIVLIVIYACLFIPQVLLDEIGAHFPALSSLDKVAIVFVMGVVAPFVNAIVVTAYSLLRQQLSQNQENVAIS